ncbi:polysaccharide biosynthesis protein [Candidatus Micrarchaeota archaeon]|nr:polysaccharide biosynthesis protein [Candidatus Micrarchaeota archaeon]MBU1930210.1 polysaccharide biosynthesis protein [Candidatus Micrarchaeota archaeon]
MAELQQLAPFYKKFEHFFVTFKRPDSEALAKTKTVFFVERPARNPLKTLKCLVQSFRILRREKPHLILSTGADAAIPILVLAKLFGKKIIFVESFCRTISPSWSGRIAYRLADLFIYQWKELERFFPKGKFGGSVF